MSFGSTDEVVINNVQIFRDRRLQHYTQKYLKIVALIIKIELIALKLWRHKNEQSKLNQALR